jgi:hypothetical protein
VEDKWQVCGICAFPLDRFSKPDGTLVGYAHFLPPDDGHVAVPVDADQVEHKQTCDFCPGGPVVWILPARSFQMLPETAVTPGQMSHGAWGACDECGFLIQRNRWSALITRVMRETHHRVPRPALEYLYDRLRVNLTEPMLSYDAWRARQEYPLPSD